jgi:hypothetical protein
MLGGAGVAWDFLRWHVLLGGIMRSWGVGHSGHASRPNSGLEPTRNRRCMSRKGTCPYALRGLKLPTYDWWELLQMEPEELAQKLSTQAVAA